LQAGVWKAGGFFGVAIALRCAHFTAGPDL